MRKIYRIAGLCIFGLLLVWLVGLKFVINYWIQANCEPEMYAQMQDFFDHRIDLPDEYFSGPIYSPEILAEGERIEKLCPQSQLTQMNFLPLEKLNQGITFQETEWLRITNELNLYKSYLDQLIVFSKRPDYQMNIWGLDPKTGTTLYISKQISAKALALRAYSAARGGQWDDAFEDILAIFRLTKRFSGDTLITHLVAFAIEGIACDPAMQLAHTCDQPDVLKKALTEMKRLDASINLDNIQQAQTLDILASLRNAKKTHPDIDLTPGKTGFFYYSQSINTTLLAEMASHSSWPQNLPPRWMLEWGIKLGFSRQVSELFYSLYSPNIINAKTREWVALSKYRLAQLTLASRLRELETGSAPTDITQLVPDYFSKIPRDPFAKDDSKSNFQIDPTKKVFYSLGPDSTNDGNQVIYDPSNGMFSVGDISPIFP